MDSYIEFLDYFNIDLNQFVECGLSAVIFPPVDQVRIEWDYLKNRVFNNERVFIRGYGRTPQGISLYRGPYQFLFDNFNVDIDPTNNTIPHKLIYKLTDLKRNKTIFNYQVSHIWGRTKNIFMFECPWNICYTPKLMNPFTGHESSGKISSIFKTMFLKRAYSIYEPFISEYNNIILQYDIQNKIDEYLASTEFTLSEREINRFRNDAKKELSCISIPE